MTYHCEIIDRPAQPTLSIRTRTSVQDLPQTLGKAFGDISKVLGELGEAPVGAPFVAYYNMDMQDLDIEIGFPVARALPGKFEVQSGMMPAGKAATCLHTGPYDGLGLAYKELNAWVVQNDHKTTGVAYEFYVNDPTNTPPAELQTQLFFPLSA
jgi:effector-binding domain-containing protein